MPCVHLSLWFTASYTHSDGWSVKFKGLKSSYIFIFTLCIKNVTDRHKFLTFLISRLLLLLFPKIKANKTIHLNVSVIKVHDVSL